MRDTVELIVKALVDDEAAVDDGGAAAELSQLSLHRPLAGDQELGCLAIGEVALQDVLKGEVAGQRHSNAGRSSGGDRGIR